MLPVTNVCTVTIMMVVTDYDEDYDAGAEAEDDGYKGDVADDEDDGADYDDNDDDADDDEGR